MTRRREIYAFYLVLFENKLGGRLLEGERLLETIRYVGELFFYFFIFYQSKRIYQILTDMLLGRICINW